MDISKVLEILSKHIIRLEEDIYLKDYEIKKLKEKISSIETHLDKYRKENKWKRS